MSLFDRDTTTKTDDLWEHRIQEAFKKEKQSDLDFIFRITELIIYFNYQNNINLIELYKSIGIDAFCKVLTLFDNMTVKFPAKSDVKETLMLSLIYYMREIKGYSWEDIKKEFPYDVSTISYGIRIKKINNQLHQRIQEMIHDSKKDK